MVFLDSSTPMDYLEPKHTERLLLRPLSLDDTEWASELLSNDGRQFLPPPPGISPINHAEFFIRKQLSRYASDSYGLFALESRQTKEFIGFSGLLLQNINGTEELEIGYHLLAKHRGNGYATEAASFLRDYAFEHRLADSLISIIDVENDQSIAVAKRIGMTPEMQIRYAGMNTYIFRIHPKS